MAPKKWSFAPSRIKAIAHEDDTIGTISKNALAAIALSAELFIHELASLAATSAREASRPSIAVEDLNSESWMKPFVDTSEAESSSSTNNAVVASR